MKKVTAVLLCILMCLLSLTACKDEYVYTPTGEFYVKTSPANGDAGVSEVISLEADHKTYEGDSDITVPMTVGFGHLPGETGYGDDIDDTFYISYVISEAPWRDDVVPAWEKRVDYEDSWYDAKYDSTDKEDEVVLFIFPKYNEFFPLYKESVDIVFPAKPEKGYLEVTLYSVIEGHEDQGIFSLQVYFERVDGVLTLDPYDTGG